MSKFYNVSVNIRDFGDYDRNFESSYRYFKKLVEQEGIFKRCRDLSFYLKPSLRCRRKQTSKGRL